MTETPGSSDRADLIAALTDRDPFRRRSALEALAKSPRDLEIEEHVLRALHDSSGYVVRTATEIAGRWGLAAAAERLRSLARDRDPMTRRASLEALRTIGSDEDLGMVLALFAGDPSREVRNAAAWAVAALATNGNWRQASAALLVDPMPRHRIFGCDLVERFGDDSDRMALRFLLDDPDGHVRKAAERLLNPRGT